MALIKILDKSYFRINYLMNNWK